MVSMAVASSFSISTPPLQLGRRILPSQVRFFFFSSLFLFFHFLSNFLLNVLFSLCCGTAGQAGIDVSSNGDLVVAALSSAGMGMYNATNPAQVAALSPYPFEHSVYGVWFFNDSHVLVSVYSGVVYLARVIPTVQIQRTIQSSKKEEEQQLLLFFFFFCCIPN
jgi:hypothetical protein